MFHFLLFKSRGFDHWICLAYIDMKQFLSEVDFDMFLASFEKCLLGRLTELRLKRHSLFGFSHLVFFHGRSWFSGLYYLLAY